MAISFFEGIKSKSCSKFINFIKDLQNMENIESLNLLTSKKWENDIIKNWKIGETEAKKNLNFFIKNKINGYKEDRNIPCKNNTSVLSAHLHFGEISPNQIWYEVLQNFPETGGKKDKNHFLSELAWHEFSYYLLCHNPELPEKNLGKRANLFCKKQKSSSAKITLPQLLNYKALEKKH